jgi:predicted small metal-binding protein
MNSLSRELSVFHSPVIFGASSRSKLRAFKEEPMAKELRCGDVVPGCDFVAGGDSEQEILEWAAVHASVAHGVKEITPELAKK